MRTFLALLAMVLCVGPSTAAVFELNDDNFEHLTQAATGGVRESHRLHVADH